jgi:DNA topoisomerase I
VHSPDAVRLSLGADNERAVDLYQLIYQRFLASQMAAAIFNEVLVTVQAGVALFAAKGSQLAFDGFLRVYGYSEEVETSKRADESEEDEPNNKQLPALKVGEQVQANKLVPQQHWTQAPPHYSEALLVKALEQAGVGRPSTYAQTLATLKARGYAVVEKRKLVSTPLGQQVLQALQQRLPGLFEVDFTAQMETALDEIAAGQRDGRAYLRDFWGQVAPLFGEAVIQATLASSATGKSGKAQAAAAAPKRATPTKAKSGVGDGVCPRCGAQLVQRQSARGAFWGCSAFPKCRHTQP